MASLLARTFLQGDLVVLFGQRDGVAAPENSTARPCRQQPAGMSIATDQADPKVAAMKVNW
ncbi:MAG TPA: hypothetical protein VFB84_00485 [Micromonosporaceae bacterium]|nr:hypothetical protein [Micromonosporaceae bacterium]